MKKKIFKYKLLKNIKKKKKKANDLGNWLPFMDNMPVKKPK